MSDDEEYLNIPVCPNCQKKGLVRKDEFGLKWKCIKCDWEQE